VRIADFGSGRTTLAWSRDGRQLAFDVQLVTPLTDTDACSRTVWATYVMNGDGTGLRRVATDTRAPSWSPGGTRLVTSGGDGAVRVVSADGKIDRKVASGAFPAWSPRTDRIAFTVMKQGMPIALAVIASDGTHRHRLAPYGWRPLWSPDGRTLAFSGTSGCVNCDLVAIGVQPGARARPIAHEPNNDDRWSPDGRWIAVDAFDTVRLVDPTGRRRARVVAAGRDTFDSIAWSADGRRLYATIVSWPTLG
jgi:Tol biopolymer transport system component